MVVHQEYGEQFKIDSFEKTMPQTLEALEQYLGKPLVCNDNRRFFYSMAAYNEELRKQYTTEELEKIKAEIEQQF